MARQEMLDEEHRLFLDLPPMQELLDGEHQYIDIDLLRGTMTPLDGVEDFDLTADHHLYLVAPAGINFPEVKFTESGQLAKICERVDPEEEEESMDLRFWDVSFVEGERKKLVKEGPFLTREIMAFFKVSREKGSGKVGFEIVPHVETANPPVDEVNSDLQSVAAEQESEEGAHMWIYLIKYLCEETGEMRWLYEAKGESESLELCRRLEANGKKPELHRVYLSPSWLLSCDPDGERISDFSSELANV